MVTVLQNAGHTVHVYDLIKKCSTSMHLCRRSCILTRSITHDINKLDNTIMYVCIPKKAIRWLNDKNTVHLESAGTLTRPNLL